MRDPKSIRGTHNKIYNPDLTDSFWLPLQASTFAVGSDLTKERLPVILYTTTPDEILSIHRGHPKVSCTINTFGKHVYVSK